MISKQFIKKCKDTYEGQTYYTFIIMMLISYLQYTHTNFFDGLQLI